MHVFYFLYVLFTKDSALHNLKCIHKNNVFIIIKNARIEMLSA